jgi:zinc transport system permease protein
VIEALHYDFMRNALLAGVLVSIAAGIVGALVTTNRIVFLAGGIAHAAYGGIGLGYFLRTDPTVGALGFSLLAAVAMGVVRRTTRQRADTLIGVLWALGMAVGVVFIDLTPGYTADLMSFLFGSILTVPAGDLLLMLALDVVILGVVALCYKELLALSFDETFATIRNVPVAAVDLLLVGVVALAVVMMMRVVGLILVIAMLTIPASLAARVAKDLRQTMGLACLLGLGFVTIGLGLSYALNLTSGATIILVAGAAYLLMFVVTEVRRRYARRATAR